MCLGKTACRFGKVIDFCCPWLAVLCTCTVLMCLICMGALMVVNDGARKKILNVTRIIKNPVKSVLFGDN